VSEKPELNSVSGAESPETSATLGEQIDLVTGFFAPAIFDCFALFVAVSADRSFRPFYNARHLYGLDHDVDRVAADSPASAVGRCGT